MIGAMLFVIVIAAGVFKMVYDHQIFKDTEKIRSYKNNINGEQEIE
jgi:hypothetical protein